MTLNKTSQGIMSPGSSIDIEQVLARNCTVRSGSDQLGILRHYAARIVWLVARPTSAPFGNFLIGEFNTQLTVWHVHNNDVAFMHQPNWSTRRRFRRNVTDHQSACCTRETSIRDQHDLAADALSLNSRRHAEH